MRAFCVTVLFLGIFLPAYSQPPLYNSSFGSEGKVLTNLANDATSYTRCLVLQPDGKILMGGYAFGTFYMIRSLVSGQVDSSFGNDGKVILKGLAEIHSIAVQADGKILALTNSYNAINCIRLKANGSIDSTYNGTGKVSIGITPGILVQGRKIAIQPDGKLVVTGFAVTNNLKDVFIARVHVTGLMDSSFDTDGKKTISLSTTLDDEGTSVAFQSTGKIIISGYTYTSTLKETVAIRLNADGTADSTFDNDGIFSFAFSGQSEWRKVAVQSNDMIVLAGNNEGRVIVMRLNADGSRDFGFGTSGYREVTFGHSELTDLIIKPAGQIILTTASLVDFTQDWDFGVIQLTSGGTPDANFNSNGTMYISVTNAYDWCHGGVLLQDGRLLLLGNSMPLFTFTAVRVYPFGSVDLTFGTNGIRKYEITPTNDNAKGFVVLPDNRIVAAAIKDRWLMNVNRTVLVRYLQNGVVDSTFGIHGRVTVPVSNFYLTNLNRQTDGKFLLTGQSQEGNTVIIRLNDNGSMDNTYPANGMFVIPAAATSIQPTSSILQQDDKLLVAGNVSSPSGNDISVTRIKTNGTLDNAFGTNGRVVIDIDIRQTYTQRVTMQNDGKILITGHIHQSGDTFSDMFVVRLKADGSLDNTFDTDGIKKLQPVPLKFNIASDVGVQADGKIVLGGVISADSSYLAVVRLLTNGTPDSSFNGNGVVKFSNTGRIVDVLSLSISHIGQIYLGGIASDSSNNYSGKMILGRITKKGRVDSSFSASSRGLMTIEFNAYYGRVTEMDFSPSGSLIMMGEIDGAPSMNFQDIAFVSLIPVNSPVKSELCPGGSTTLQSNVTGSSYQWQLNSGNGFVNISNNSNYSGTNTRNLNLNNIPSSFTGYEYRASINGIYSDIFVLRFVNGWNGTISTAWENPANWSCGTVPDINTDVVIAGGSVVVNSNVTIRSLTLAPGVIFTVNSGFTFVITH